MRRFLASVVCLLVAACGERDDASTEPVADPATTTATAQGQLTGYVSPEGAHVWHAIPYAAPPVGDLRWRAPRPAGSWTGNRDALTRAERCSQITNSLDQGRGVEAGLRVGSEDCLYLDVFAPPGAVDLPVMVWIHGGSNVWGSIEAYDGSQLAIDQNVIIIMVQYRLGPLGWFAHPALREDAETAEDGAADFAILDLIAALRWTRENAHAFGGNPGRVTIFGESAGGHNVAALLASPLAAGLFDRAIIQSGSIASVPLAEAEGRIGEAANPSLTIAERLVGADASADDLRAVDLDDLFAAYETGGGFRLTMPTMIADGVVLPLDGLRSAFASEETFNAVPVITGTNRDEMKLFNALDPRLASRHLGVFYRPRDRGFYDALSDYQSRVWAIGAVDDLATIMREGGHEDVWAYRFDWDEGGSNVFIDTGFMLGAAHAMEIPFVFNRFELFGQLDRFLFNDRNAESREALARTMGQHWGNFARTGHPGADWPRWGERGQRMRFDTEEDGGPEVVRGAETMESIAERLSGDQRLTPEERCQVAATLGDRFFGEGGGIAEMIGCG
ncbi:MULTISPECIES: carboxylesterase/lipase family protein [Hyphobacterium]|uniref:Carboxylic ester hydrolase n=1 Tax=Hyphobacterium vulgare TaxID=1736751 RepID=A0ABV6ZZF5_9PROT